MAKIVAFYRGEGTDAAGRSIRDVWRFNHRELESAHDFIQWLFPLPEPSTAQAGAPILTLAELLEFKKDPKLRACVLQSLALMRDFYERTEQWNRAWDHNHHRITRILRFLTLTGFEIEAREFFNWCDSHAERPSETSRWYWREALDERPAWLTGSSR